jgi:hypothetical protein
MAIFSTLMICTELMQIEDEANQMLKCRWMKDRLKDGTCDWGRSVISDSLSADA